MGGSSSKKTPINTPQSNAALAGASGAASNLGSLGANYSGEQQQLFNLLWGSPTGSSTAPLPGAPQPQIPSGPTNFNQAITAQGDTPFMAGGKPTSIGRMFGVKNERIPQSPNPVAPVLSGAGATAPAGAPSPSGVLTSMLDPSKLNVTSPAGPFAGAFTNDKDQLAQAAARNAEDIKSQAAQSGFGASTPSGMVNRELAENNQNLAGQVGQAFTTETGNSYNDALTNFWKAADAALGQAGTAQSGALQGTGAAGNIYNSLYGQSLGENTQNNAGVMGVVSPILSAGGQVGAAAVCVARGTLIAGEGTEVPVEEVKKGFAIRGVDGAMQLAVADASKFFAACVELHTDNGLRLTCSKSHTLMRPDGGYVRAGDALGQRVRTLSGPSTVTEVRDAGEQAVWMLKLDGSHTYLANSIWSEE